MKYYRRIYKKILKHTEKKQITLITGPRQAGKTTLMKQLQDELKSKGENTFFLTLEKKIILQLLNSNPENIFQTIPFIDSNKKIFVFIDEIQYLDDPSNFLKLLYDLYSEKIKFIVSGSSSFYIDSKFKDSMAGRKRIFELMTLSFEELLEFKGKNELLPYINSGIKTPLLYRQEIDNYLCEYLLFGGYPDVVLEDDIDEKFEVLKEIGESYVKKDAIEAELKYPDAYLNILKVLAGQSGSLFNSQTLSSTMHMSHNAIQSYTRLMRKSYHISLIKPFYRNAAKELTKMPKIYFNDLGLRNYFLKDFSPLGLREDKGELLELFSFRRFLDFYSLDDIKYWRTQKKQEVDFIINCGRTTQLKAFEVKFTKKQFNPVKYKFFKATYPEIPLSLLTRNNIFEMVLADTKKNEGK